MVAIPRALAPRSADAQRQPAPRRRAAAPILYRYKSLPESALEDYTFHTPPRAKRTKKKEGVWGILPPGTQDLSFTGKLKN